MKEAIFTKEAPDVIGPYSQAIQHGNMIFVSGQLPVTPSSGEIQSGDVREQTRQSLDNLRAILEKAGTDLSAVVKTTVFIQNMSDFSSVNEIYSTYFSGTYPARTCVEVARLPKNALVEIEAIAVR
ncbi:RidA family protein [Salmonella enterica subsp. enterica serovar Cubana]|jgi:2-iminobutanoate/2-iminopropanoate deaminase|uniref:RidA family protein n=1 Tax=Enterobacteriaceae TaxID=543 RepID=UPI0004D7AC1A|nr:MULTISPECIES: RidA family protein [Enterobacteriaceae]HDC0655091.1 RidA family protein [Salmonella enterica]EHD7145417.1 RidA family protein [Salmonella enterica subsp. enterica serovar Cubana]EHD9055944.1 RidA family protein [Salmonella enterica subsp. enterica serovar Cubana]EHD9060672.1 RidA family protein [Salmonella enterica subsp. enterica serovar Cubana]EHD9065342.1 RidA family protein [Salmonella enterica subsp. enterica serovar Cubana]